MTEEQMMLQNTNTINTQNIFCKFSRFLYLVFTHDVYIWQAEWREEVKKHFEKIKSEGTCIHRLDEELIRRRRDELR